MADEDSTPGKSPAFRFYPSDFVNGTITLTTEEVGAYMLLMCHCWDKGSIPSDVALLARIARLSTVKMRRVWASISSKFVAQGDGYIQARLEKERAKQSEYRRRQSDRAAKRWHPPGNATALQQTHPPGSCHDDAFQFSDFSIQSSDSSKRENTHRAGAFIEWYQDKHQELFGMGYIGNPQKDYQKAIELCQGLTDSELRDAALVWFGMQDDFATRGNRTIPKFASRVAECVQLARRVSA